MNHGIAVEPSTKAAQFQLYIHGPQFSEANVLVHHTHILVVHEVSLVHHSANHSLPVRWSAEVETSSRAKSCLTEVANKR